MHLAIVTGGSRGIGEATIHYFMDKEWQAMNIARTDCSHPKVINLAIDFSNPDEVFNCKERLTTHIPKQGAVITLVHNAGFQTRDTIETMSYPDLVTTLNINLIASSILNQMIIPYMLAGSSIIYVGSMLSDQAVPNNASYIISKHAVLGLMRATAQDLRCRGIHTCCVCPGLVETELLKQSVDNAMIDFLLETYILGKRLIKPQEIAELIYQCSQTPVLNGGLIPATLGIVAR